MTAPEGLYAFAPTFNGGYDQSYTAGAKGERQQGHWHLHAATGKGWIRPEGETVPLDAARQSKPFHTFDDLAAWCADRYGITGWKRDKVGRWLPADGSTDVPCGEKINPGGLRITRFSVCDKRRKPGEAKCGQHLSVDKRRAEREEAERVERRASNAGRAIADDLVARLAAFVRPDEQVGVKGSPVYSWRTNTYTGGVEIHAEDVGMLLDEIERLREIERYA